MFMCYYDFQEMVIGLFDLCPRKSLYCLPSTPPIVCTRPEQIQPCNNNARALLLYIHWQPFTSSCSLFFSPHPLSIVEVYLSSRFSFSHISVPQLLLWYPKGNDSPIRERGRCLKVLFRSGETRHSKMRKTQHCGHFHFRLRAPCIMFTSFKWIISCDGQFNTRRPEKD